MKEVLLATAVGFVVGALFTLIKLPLPAPPVLPGVMGIFGIYAGGQVAAQVIERLGQGG